MRCAQVTSDLLSSVAQTVDREVAAQQGLAGLELDEVADAEIGQ
jgi:hypothetical protein